MREVMKNPPSEEIIKYIFEPMLVTDKEKYFRFNNYINKAHLMMLKSQGIVTEKTAKTLYQAIRKLESEGVDALELDPNREDISSCIEAYLIKECGAAIAGQLHTGRSRNDMGGTTTRMSFREATLTIMDQIDQLRDCMLRFAKNNIDAVCSGYTCAQPAEPVTIAYWFCAYLSALERDRARLSDCWSLISLRSAPVPWQAPPLISPANRPRRTWVLSTPHELSRCHSCQRLYSGSLRPEHLQCEPEPLLPGSVFYTTYEYGFLDVDSSVLCAHPSCRRRRPSHL